MPLPSFWDRFTPKSHSCSWILNAESWASSQQELPASGVGVGTMASVGPETASDVTSVSVYKNPVLCSWKNKCWSLDGLAWGWNAGFPHHTQRGASSWWPVGNMFFQRHALCLSCQWSLCPLLIPGVLNRGFLWRAFWTPSCEQEGAP